MQYLLRLPCSQVEKPARLSDNRPLPSLVTLPACDSHKKSCSVVVSELPLQVQHHESKLEHAQFTSADGVNEDLALSDQMVDILSSEDSGGMLQALEE